MLLLTLFLFFFAIPVSGEIVYEHTSKWFIPLREAVYEQQLSADEILNIYSEILSIAGTSLSGDTLYITLSNCEYLMGKAYQFEERNSEASAHYSNGIAYAEKALEIQESAEAWMILARNISQSCAVRPVSYALANGLKVERYAKNALALNSRNAAAQYLIAARWVFAPSPFHNYNRGIRMLSAIIDEGDMEKDDIFNIYYSLGYVYIQQKNNTQARMWLLKAMEIYPTNKEAQYLLAKL